MKNLFIFLFLLVSAIAEAQEKKQEKEEGIERQEMPPSTSFLIEKIPEKAKRLRFYYETDGETVSYEAKFKYKRSIFSVEFGKEGNLQDVEVTIESKELPKQTLQNIESYLEKNQERHKIEKIQAQYSSSDIIKSAEAKLLLKSLSFKTNEPENYELIVAVKNKGKLQKFEMIFDKEGHYHTKREIIRNSYDYLIF